MDDKQLRLVPPPQPLVERLGESFFREIPRRPGVYRMYDVDGILVYVGKALDLRERLGTYRRTAGQSRKTIRLIHVVRRIEWESCESEMAALLRENELIRTLRPRFNRAGVWPKSARYVRWEGEGSVLRMTLVSEPVGGSHGPFRGGPGRVLAAMARLLWLAWTGGGVSQLPRRWVTSECPKVVEFEHVQVPHWVASIRGYFEGIDDGLVARLVEGVPEPEHRFEMAYVASQFETLELFFRTGPARNRRLRLRFGADEGEEVTPERMDDWRILAGAEALPPPFRPESADSGLDLGGAMQEHRIPEGEGLC